MRQISILVFTFVAAAHATAQTRDREFLVAANRLDVSTVRRLLSKSSAQRPRTLVLTDALGLVAAKDPSGLVFKSSDPPRWAVVASMAGLLLDHGAAPQPAVSVAAQYWNHEILDLLLRRGGRTSTENGAVLFGSLCSSDATNVLEKYDPVLRIVKRPKPRREESVVTLRAVKVVARMDKTVEVLLRHGADPNRAGTWGVIPFHRSCYWGRGPQVRAMLRYGAKPNLRRKPFGRADKGDYQPDYTPLHCAALRDSPRNAEVVFILLKGGADWRLKDELGRTPYELAKAKGNQRIVRAFESAGVRS